MLALLMLALLLGGLLLGGLPMGRATAAAEHPAHLSYTEMEYDRASGILQVAMRVVPEDLEQALRWRTGQRVHLDAEPATEALVAAHLRERFVVVEADGRRAPLQWVGMEVSAKDAWLYFELPLRQGFEGLRMADDLFFELQADQVHALKFWADPAPASEGTRLNLRFSAEHRAFRLHPDRAEPVARDTLPPGTADEGEARGEVSAAPPPPRAEPLLRARYEECLAALPELLFALPDPAEGPLPDDMHRRLLDALQPVGARLDETALRTQLAVVQLCTGHLDSGLEHLRHGADESGVIEAAHRLSRTLRDAARWLEDEGRPVRAGQLRQAAERARIEL